MGYNAKQLKRAQSQIDKAIAAGGAFWLDDITEQQIVDMENSGVQVDELRKFLAQKGANEEIVQEAYEAKLATRIYNLDRLQPYKRTPLSEESEFFKDFAGKPPLFGKEKWRQKHINAQLVYTGIVQANNDLWEPGEMHYGPCVVVFTIDNTYRYDKDFIREIAEKLEDFRDRATVPDDCKKIVSQLRDSHSNFCYKVGFSITGGVEVWCCVDSITNQADLPFKCLPSDRIVPMMLIGDLKEKYNPILAQIPGRYYK